MEDWSKRLSQLDLPDEDEARIRALLLEKPSSDRSLYFVGSDEQAKKTLKQLLQLHGAGHGSTAAAGLFWSDFLTSVVNLATGVAGQLGVPPTYLSWGNLGYGVLSLFVQLWRRLPRLNRVQPQ